MHSRLVAQAMRTHKRAVPDPLFDQAAQRLRRRRARSKGPELFVHDRAFEEILERIGLVRRNFRSALVVGWPADHWQRRLADRFEMVTVLDDPSGLPGLPPAGFDLCVVIGMLDTADDLPLALAILRHALAPDGLLVGAIPGGETLPRLRTAMRAADDRMGWAAPHVHPRIEPGAFAMLLSQAGFGDPVVDVERLPVSYPGLRNLVRDLRAMAATNVLSARPRAPLTRAAVEAATAAFSSGSEGRTTETFELLHFAAWTSVDDKQH